MTTPTGFIQASDVNVELGRASNAPLNLNETAVRNLAGKPSGAISMNDLRGKSAISFTPAAGSYDSYDADFANYTITANQSVTWNWTATNGLIQASSASGAAATSITFSLPRGQSQGETGDVFLNTTVNGVLYSWTITLTVGI